ncbi:MAG: hypothetical protein RSA62_05975 [Oscillospiraceae bacterium]
MEQLQHCEITKIERNGYAYTGTLVCDTCRNEIGTEFYGELDGRLVCGDCVEQEFAELSAPEKIEKLGYTAEFNG